MRRTLMLGLCVVLWSCSSGVTIPDPLIESPQEMMDKMAYEPPSSFLAEARIEFYADNKARKGKVLIMAAPPDQLRFEVLSFTDDLLALLIVTKDGFGYYERGAKTCNMGPLCAAPQASQMPMASNPVVLANLLLGRIPFLPEPDEQSIEFSTDDGRYHLVLKKGVHEQHVAISPKHHYVRKAVLKKDGKTLYRITFEGTMKADGKTVPRRLRLESPSDSQDSDISIDYREVDFDVKFHGDPFQFECPMGMLPNSWECPTAVTP